jgi:hypothetical protein
MKKMLCLAVILVSIAAAAPASAQSFGELFPLTNTRYDTAIGTPRLAANGQDFFLFWSTERKIRATSLAQSGPRVGHVVLDTSGRFDVAWTGEVFLAASSRPFHEYSNDANIIGRLLDAEAQPLGDELTLAEHGREPRIAAGPEAIVMVYRGTGNDTRVVVLGPRGESTGAESRSVQQDGMGYAVAANDAGFVIAFSNANDLRTITLDRQGRVVSERALPRTARSYREVALATDGERYLLAWCTNGPGETAAAVLDENGSFGEPFVFAGSNARSLSAVWTGVRWSVSQESKQGPQLHASVTHLDRALTRILAKEESAAGGVANPSLASVNGRVMAAWNPFGEQSGPSSVVELPIAANQPRVATYAATQQTLLATASSADATLMVWSERSDDGTSIHTGVRTRDGQWTEQELGTAGTAAAAASDGTRFVVMVRTENSSGAAIQKVVRLDETGRPLASSVSVPGYEAVIAWNGTHYALITSAANLEGRLLSPSGALSAPVKIPRDPFSESFGKLALASNEDGFLLAGEMIECQFLLCAPRALKGMRLGADLQRIDAEEITLDSEYAELAGAVWNGSEYVVVWKGASDGLFTARVPAAAASPAAIAHTDTDILPRSVAAMPGGNVAVVGPAGASNVIRVAFLRKDGGIAQTFDFDSATVTGTPLLTALPDGVAYVASSVQDAAPHHGTSHVMMAIARPSVPAPPYPPHVVARLQNGVILVDWSASAGTLNGYRLEYRVDGGSWNELEEWFPADSHHRAIRPTFGTNFEIRMRAFNDGGVSAYSATALTKPTRRRAAR